MPARNHFSEVLLSIEEIYKKGLGSEIHINTRYYPEHKESVVDLCRILKEKFGIKRSAYLLIEVNSRGANQPDAPQHIERLRFFAKKFWGDLLDGELPVPHPNTLPYNSKRYTCFCKPTVQPDGYIYTCDYKHGIRVGSIDEDDVFPIIKRLLNVDVLNPTRCNKCNFAQALFHHYCFQVNNIT